MDNSILTANTLAWQKYEGSQPFRVHREDFDNGWEAALDWKRGSPTMTQNTRTTHTPGPWRVFSPSPGVDSGIVENESKRIVATASLEHFTLGQRAANARLIALAPRMEQALRAIVWAGDFDAPGFDEHNAAFHTARAILAELDGEGTATT